MKLLRLLLTVFVASFTCDAIDVNSKQATIYVESVNSLGPARPLAEVRYDPLTPTAEIVSFDALNHASENELVRVGIYDTKMKAWVSSTSVTTAATFAKGYSPIIILHIDRRGDVLGVSCKSGRIDAGHTRDFGPKAKVVKIVESKTPELNKPVVLSKEGKVEAVEPEKTFFQKYWMFFLGITVVLLMSGGGDK